VQKNTGGIEEGKFPEALLELLKQLFQVLVVDHEVRHLEQSFVTTKLRVRTDVNVRYHLRELAACCPPRATVSRFRLIGGPKDPLRACDKNDVNAYI